MNNIIAVVVTYNRKSLLKECISALLAQTIDDVDVLIVDNHSTDGTFDYLSDIIDNYQVRYFDTGKNLGGAGGFNIGIRKAYELGYEYIWVMDDDTIPYPDCAEKLIKTAKGIDNQFGFLSSYAEWTDGTPCIMNIQTVSPEWITCTDYLEEGILRVDYASFVSMLIRREAVRKCGLPIKEFFIWGDDAEYSWRLSQNYKNYFVYQSKVIHKMGSNKWVDIKTEKDERIGRFFYLYRNRMYLSRKEGKTRGIKNFVHNLMDAMKVINTKQSGKLKKAGIILKGTFMGLSFNPKIEFVD